MSLLMLIISFITSGVSAILGKALIEWGLGDYRDIFQLTFYSVGMILGFILLSITRSKSKAKDAGVGFTMGIFATLSFVCFLIVLTSAAGIVAFPIRSIGGLVLTAFVSIIAWHEKLSRSQWLAIILSLIAMWLIY